MGRAYRRMESFHVSVRPFAFLPQRRPDSTDASADKKKDVCVFLLQYVTFKNEGNGDEIGGIWASKVRGKWMPRVARALPTCSEGLSHV